MRTLPPSLRGCDWRNSTHAFRAAGGFTLVETSLAIGIVAFAFVALIGLLPAGLTTFREAMDTSVGAQIVQRIAGELQETDFQLVVNHPGARTGGDGGQFFVLPLRYFDEQGNELRPPTEATPAERQRMLYTVRIRGSRPGAADPGIHGRHCFTSLPAANGARFNPRDLTLLTIQIANNPGLRDVTPLLDHTSELIDIRRARTAGMNVRTYPVALARNGYAAPATIVPTSVR